MRKVIYRYFHRVFYLTRFPCRRLRRSEDHLRDELDVVRADAHAREDDLLERIRELEGIRGGSQEDELRTANMQVRLVSFCLPLSFNIYI
jgi:hypothetical protein